MVGMLVKDADKNSIVSSGPVKPFRVVVFNGGMKSISFAGLTALTLSRSSHERQAFYLCIRRH
jgi:hypothetical protein